MTETRLEESENKMEKKRSGRHICMVVAAAILWGTYGSFVTKITELGLGQNALVCLRFVFTALPMFFFLLARHRDMLKIEKRHIPLFLANGIVSIVFFTSCYTAAIRVTKIATAAALLYTAPAIVLIFSVILFKEKLNALKVVSILVAVLGCALVSGLGNGDAGLTLSGVLLGLGAGLGYALYSIFSRLIADRGYSTYTNVFYTFLIAALVYLGLSIADGSVVGIIELPVASGLTAVCGLLTGCAAYVLYTTGLSKLNPPAAAQMATIEPVTAAILGVVLFDQSLGALEILGVILVVASVIVMNYKSNS